MSHKLIDFLKLAYDIEEYTKDCAPSLSTESYKKTTENIIPLNDAFEIRRLILQSQWIHRYTWHDYSVFKNSKIDLKELVARYIGKLCIMGDGTAPLHPFHIVKTAIDEILKSQKLWSKLCRLQHHELNFPGLTERDPLLHWEVNYQLGLHLLKRVDNNDSSLLEIIAEKLRKLSQLDQWSEKLITDGDWQTLVGNSWAIVCRGCIIAKREEMIGKANWKGISKRLEDWRNLRQNNSFELLVNKIVVDAWRKCADCIRKGMGLEDFRRLWSKYPIGALYLVCNILSELGARICYKDDKAFVPSPRVTLIKPTKNLEISFITVNLPPGIIFPQSPVDRNRISILSYFFSQECFYVGDVIGSVVYRPNDKIYQGGFSRDQEDIKKSYLKGVLSIRKSQDDPNNLGTAFVVYTRSKYFIVTCAHVIYFTESLKKETYFRTMNGDLVKGDLIVYGPPPEKAPYNWTANQDIAIYSMNWDSADVIEPQAIYEDDLKTLKSGFCFGYVNSLTVIGDWIENISWDSWVGSNYCKLKYDCDVRFEAGFSGSPVASNNGKIIGVLRANVSGDNKTCYIIPINLVIEAIHGYLKREG